MNTVDKLLKQLETTPDSIEFNDIISAIEQHYEYTPTGFTNGEGDDGVVNNAGENEGSCKIFAFARLHSLTKEQTLHCFGHYYRGDVLEHPENDDHANIRQFMKYGWKQVMFEGNALEEK